MKQWCLVVFAFLFTWSAGSAQSPGDESLAEYFRAETRKLSDQCLADITTRKQWEERKPIYRQQLFDMLGLDPLPAKTELNVTITGKVEKEDFVVEKLHFQSRPGLYVTANFYLPKNVSKPLPTILYLCGHAKVITNGISFGNKTAYQHHGIWFARNGYACLVVDTLQLGEIEGIHHGTYNQGMWWWNSRGYTPAGVEAWNNIRALDYLETRAEVDKQRIGVTGRSGGGAYSWTLAALDDRIAAAAPVAGITDLENHVVDGKVEGHCDCMFHVNTYRWDFPLLAALTAPRPLLFCNSDRDRIFPLEGIIRTHSKVRDVYRLYGMTNQLGLLITPGDHEDTQDLQVPVFRWFHQYLKRDDAKIAMTAEKLFAPAELKVFDKLPADAINARVHESFVPTAEDRHARQDLVTIKKELRQRVFAGWPAEARPVKMTLLGDMRRDGVRLAAYEFKSQPHVPLRLYLFTTGNKNPKRVRLKVFSESEWDQWFEVVSGGFPELLEHQGEKKRAGTPSAYAAWRKQFLAGDEAIAVFAPRGIGAYAWTDDAKKQTHIRRRFMLLGQTLDGMRVWDIVKAGEALRVVTGDKSVIVGEATGLMSVNLVYASLFSSDLRLDSETERQAAAVSCNSAPDYLNIERVAAFSDILLHTKNRVSSE